MSDIEVRTALVTGASSGLGAAIARALGELGWRVVLAARRMDRLEKVAREVEVAGGSVATQMLDVTDPASVDLCFDAAEKRFGCVDVVVNNAGASWPGALQDLAIEAIQSEVAVNLLGPTYVARRAIPPLLARGAGGDLVFISSDAAIHPRPHQSLYTATKAGLEALARTIGMELEGTGIRSTIVRPGPVYSEYAASWGEERITKLMTYWQHFGLQRHGGFMPPEAVGRAVVLAVTTPPGVHLDTIEVQPEAPRE